MYYNQFESSPIPQHELRSNFWQRVKEEQIGVTFQKTWLNKITEEAQIEYVNEFKKKNNKEKFKHILQVPLIVTDKQFLRRRKTFQTYTKNATLDLYYLQMKKARGIGKSISEKADYNEVIQQTKNNKIQDDYLKSLKKNQGIMYDNTLWSDKYYNQIIQQSRLSNLERVLQRNKFKGREELLAQFEQFFASKQLVPESKKTVEELITDIQQAFIKQVQPPVNILETRKQNYNKELIKTEGQQSTTYTRPQTQQGGYRLTTETKLSNHKYYPSQYSRRSIDQIETNTRCSSNQAKRFKCSAVQKINLILTQAEEQNVENKDVFKSIESFQHQEENEKTYRSQQIRQKVQREELITTFTARNKIDVRKKFERKKNLQQEQQLQNIN